MKPANIKGANKDAKIYIRRSTTVRNLLVCVHTLCMNYVTNTFIGLFLCIKETTIVLCTIKTKIRKT